jgi:transposase-like protein
VTSTIRTTCAACGTVDIPVASAQLVLESDAGDTRNRLEFRCPTCHAPRSELVGERATRLLSNAGITVAAPAQPPASAHDGTAGKPHEHPAR